MVVEFQVNSSSIVFMVSISSFGLCSMLRVKFILFEPVSVRLFMAVFETVRVIYGFWFMHKICIASSQIRVAT